MSFNSQNVKSMMFGAPNPDIAQGNRREKRWDVLMHSFEDALLAFLGYR